MSGGDTFVSAPTGGPAILGAVLCGGRSSRFGSDKALAPTGERTMGRVVVDALRWGGTDPVAAIGGTAGPSLGLPTIADLRPGLGPLAGLATALAWARPYRVVVAPCDAPLLTGEHVAAIVRAARRLENSDGPDGEATAVVATVDGEPMISLACWPGVRSREILGMVDDGRRRFRDALEGSPWVGVELDPSAVADADTPEDLAAMLGQRTAERRADAGSERPDM